LASSASEKENQCPQTHPFLTPRESRRFKSDGNRFSFNFPASTTVTKVGWIAGIGTEGVLAGNWSAKLEALYYNLGTTTLLAGPALGAGLPGVTGFVRGKNFETDGVIVRGGLNLKLGW
jgi:outer membrane immunogenic protein